MPVSDYYSAIKVYGYPVFCASNKDFEASSNREKRRGDERPCPDGFDVVVELTGVAWPTHSSAEC